MEITSEIRMRAARVARELADKVGGGLEFGICALQKNGFPCCALGNLADRTGIPYTKVLSDGKVSDDYEHLNLLVNPNYNHKSGGNSEFLRSIYSPNDSAFNNKKDAYWSKTVKPQYVKALQESLRSFADEAESVARSSLGIKSHLPDENATPTVE